MVPFCALGLQDVLRYGASKHQWNVNLVQIVRYANVSYMVNLLKADTERRKTGNILEIMHALLMLITKTAVLLQYLRIFTPVRNRRTYLTWLLMGVNIAVAFALALSVGLQCVPRQKIWYPLMPGHCLNLGAMLLTSAISNTLTDFATWLLPFCTIWGLKLPWQRKLGVSAIFTIGLL